MPILVKVELGMTRRANLLLASVAICGLTAGALAATLVWMLLTRPVDLAERLGHMQLW